MIGCIVTFVAIFGGMTIGLRISENYNITEGRLQGIVLCTEKPKECSLEYQYIKLKETRK